MTRVLIAGGYGVVGGWIARHLRAAGHDIDLVLGGRTPESGAALAAELKAGVVALDSDDAADGLARAGAFDLVICALQDPDDNLLNAALRAGSAYVGVVRKLDNLGPTAMACSILAQRPALLLGHWQAGVTTFAALAAASALRRVDQIAIAALFDPTDRAGPMATRDSGAFFTRALMRRDGAWDRVAQADNIREIERGDLPAFMAQPMGVLDVAGLQVMTGARDVRFDIGLGQSIGAAAGGDASHDIYIDLAGEDPQGRLVRQRMLVSDPHGQAHLTALGVLVGAERLLGLDGAPPPAAGLVFPERAIDPHRATARLRAFGVRVQTEAVA
ncbi:MAG: hypothetical protein WA840_22315 [Caulobacteraceae bacterium]